MTPSKSYNDLNRQAYDQIAPAFAKRNSEITGELEAQANRLLERLGPAPLRFLDLGCGAGRDLAWFEAHGPHRFYGADLSRGMLNQARLISHAAFSQMDMLSLGFAPATFQGVWCSAALLHMPKSLLPAALAEIARVLVPGGFFSLTVQMGDSEGIEPVPYIEEHVERFFARYAPEEMAALLEQAGFTILMRGDNITGRHWLWYETQR